MFFWGPHSLVQRARAAERSADCTSSSSHLGQGTRLASPAPDGLHQKLREENFKKEPGGN